MKKSQKKEQGLVMYQTEKRGIKLRGDFNNDTIWVNQVQGTSDVPCREVRESLECEMWMI